MHVIGLRTGFGTIHQIEAVDVQAVVKRRKRGERCRPRPSHCSRPPWVLQPASSGYERRGLASRSQAPTTYPDSPDATRQGVAGLDAVHNCLKMGGAVVSQALASVLGSDTRSNVSRRLLFASLAVIASLIWVATAFASSRDYLWNTQLAASWGHSDLVSHNHYFNSIYPSDPTAGWPTGVFEAVSGGSHFVLNGNGKIEYSHPSTYYDQPWCWNRDSVAHTFSRCTAQW
jgi:hypothetical protein